MKLVLRLLMFVVCVSPAWAQPAMPPCNTPGLSCLNGGQGATATIYAAPITAGTTATVGCGTYQPVNDATALTITLPSYCSWTQPITIKDIGGNAQAHNITIKLASGSIDGAATQVIAQSYGALHIVWSGTAAGVQ